MLSRSTIAYDVKQQMLQHMMVLPEYGLIQSHAKLFISISNEQLMLTSTNADCLQQGCHAPSACTCSQDGRYARKAATSAANSTCHSSILDFMSTLCCNA